MRRLLKPARRLLRRLLIVTLALVAGVNAAAFLLTPLLDRYRDDLAALASERLGRPIAIGAMHARWRGFGPELVLNDLEVGAPGQPDRIRLGDVALDFGLWDMLRYRDLSPLRLTLRDLEVHLIRDHEGRLHLAGFEGLAGEQGEASRLPLGGRLRLLNLTVLWEDQRLRLPVRRLDNAQLRLHLWPDRLSMSASVRLPGEHPGRLQAGAELDIDGQDWSGEVYLAGALPEAAAQLGPYLAAPLRLRQGGVTFEAWSDWEASRLSSMEGTLAVDGLRLDRGADTPALDLEGARTAFRYRRNGEDRQIDLAGLQIARAGHRWPDSDLHLSLDLSRPGWPALGLSAQYLRLGDLLAMTRPIPLPAPWQGWRDGLDPDAELHDLRLAIEPGEGPPRWRINTRFDALRTHAWQQLPGVRAWQGSLQGDQRQLTLRLSARDTEMDLPQLLPAALPVSRLAGELHWERQDNGDQLFSSESVTLDTPDFQSSTRLRLMLPADGPADIDLQSAVRNGDGSHAARYYPVRHMNPRLATWLQQAIGNGRIPQGNVILRGPLADFPFDKRRNGHFEARFDVADLDLNYKPGWPPLHVDDAEVAFHNNALRIVLRRGRIYDSQVLPTEATIDSLEPTGPLHLHGAVQGPLQDPLRLLAESPLKGRFGDLVAGKTAQGDSHLTLDFSMVLHTLGEDRLQGELELQQAGLALADLDLVLSDVNGKLSFDLNGVRATDVRARALDQPLRIDVTPVTGGHRIDADTRVDAATLYRYLPALPPDLVSGTAPLRIATEIPNQRPQGLSRQVTLSSDLNGMALRLPAPLGKAAADSRPLQVTVPVQETGVPLRVQYAGLLDALFVPGGDRADIRLGGADAKLPDQPVLRLGGRLDRLALDPWLALFDDQGAGVSTLPPLHTDLRLGQLSIGRLQADDVRVRLRQQADGWDGQVDAKTFAGRFRVPPKGSDAPIVLDLSRLAFKLDVDRQQPTETPADTGKPSDWPAFDLSVAQLLINDHDFGKLVVQARHRNGTLHLDPIRLDGPLARFDGLAQWHGNGAVADSDLTGKLHSPQLGDLLAGLGYSRQFRGAPVDAELALSWPGSLGAMSPALLRGQLRLAIGEGQLLEVDPGVARVFGLLNFSALQRRLRLDFTDLFRKGLAFDSISGSFRLIDGNAYTSDLAIKSPSGDILITGRTGLATRDLYQEVTVTPRFDATLPVAGALAGGPLTGLAVLVAQQVMKEKVDKFNRIRYEVTGSWDDPQVERLGGGGGLSRILQPVTGLFDKEPTRDAEAARP